MLVKNKFLYLIEMRAIDDYPMQCHYRLTVMKEGWKKKKIWGVPHTLEGKGEGESV